MFQRRSQQIADHRLRRLADRFGIVLPAVVLLGVLAPSIGRADDDLPKAETILDKYVEVTGGKSAYAKIKNRVTKMSLEVPAQGLKATLTIYGAKPNKMYTQMEMPGMGIMESGVDGEVAWGDSMMTGPQIKEGDERALALRSAVMDGAVEWRRLFKTVQCVAVELVDGKPCYKIEMTPTEGEPETRYYDKESNLVVKTAMTVKGPMGALPVESRVGEYKEVDGILLPHETRMVVMGSERVMKIESIEHNVDLPKDRFDLPPEIQALVDKQKSEKADAGKGEPKAP